MICPSCGSDNRDGARFCAWCRGALAPDADGEAADLAVTAAASTAAASPLPPEAPPPEPPPAAPSAPPPPAASAPPPEAGVRYCPNCGDRHAVGARWCARCGEALAAATSTGGARGDDADRTASPRPVATVDAAPAPTDRRGAHARLPWVLGGVVAAIVVLAAVAAGLAWFALAPVANAYDPDYGYYHARRALLSPSDLLGAGWTVESTNEFDDSLEPTGTSDVCRAFDARVRYADTRLDRDMAGRASITLVRPGAQPDIQETRVDQSVRIYRDAAPLPETVRAMGIVMSIDDASKCLAGVSGSNVTRADAIARPPNGGSASAFIFSGTPDGRPIDIRHEYYFWSRGNAIVVLAIYGMAPDVTSALVTAAVASTDAALERAAKSTAAASATP